MPKQLEWIPLAPATRACDQMISTMDHRYREKGLDAPRIFEAYARLPILRAERWLIAILSYDPVGPGGSLQLHLSLTASATRIPNNHPGPRPSDAEWAAACEQLAPGKVFQMDHSGSPNCIHGFVG